MTEPTTDDPTLEPEADEYHALPEPEHLKVTDPDDEPAVPVIDAEPEAAPAVVQAPVDVPCPACGAMGDAEAKFCEVCGASMSGTPPQAEPEPVVAEAPPARPCARCGGKVAADGYCEECGAPAMSERDHFAISPSATVGGVCDRGIVHARNEDAMALGIVEGVTAIVVCDGVSTAPLSDEASLAASTAALEALAEGAPGGSQEVTAEGVARTSAWGTLHAEAAARANEAVLAVPTRDEADAPSCTYVAAIVDGPRVVVANVGDSRAYWLPDGGRGVRLTIDDSWAQEMMEMGVPESRVASSPNAHAITRWLGPDAPPIKPRKDTHTVTTPGWLLVCSDGLWNYCPEADDLGELVRSSAAAAGEGADATTIAGRLVTWANAQGGRDNITAVLARLGDHQAPGESVGATENG